MPRALSREEYERILAAGPEAMARTLWWYVQGNGRAGLEQQPAAHRPRIARPAAGTLGGVRRFTARVSALLLPTLIALGGTFFILRLFS